MSLARVLVCSRRVSGDLRSIQDELPGSTL
uniref:Uncharacterized protein n=1 Tax=Anguilla anguilla TaxID=7936 RepID=A0A0E9TND2_ANGAN